ncbi:hypothetical protein [Clostridium paraputrificum]|uniref:Uncharacterized protein n=1 Tax=Clostridium paraputrificum TaxID=29363 RepID=A0A6N3EWF6_9CLOT
MKQFINVYDNLSSAVKSERKCIITRQCEDGKYEVDICTSQLAEDNGILHSYFEIPTGTVSIELCSNPYSAEDMCRLAKNSPIYVENQYRKKTVDFLASVDYALSNGLVFDNLQKAMDNKLAVLSQIDEDPHLYLTDSSICQIAGYYVVLRTIKGDVIYVGSRDHCDKLIRTYDKKVIEHYRDRYEANKVIQGPSEEFLDEARIRISEELRTYKEPDIYGLFANDELLLSMNNRDNSEDIDFSGMSADKIWRKVSKAKKENK